MKMETTWHCIDCGWCEKHKNGLGICNNGDYPIPVRLSDSACMCVELCGGMEQKPQSLRFPELDKALYALCKAVTE